MTQDMSCELCHRPALHDICTHCRWSKLRIIGPTNIRKTYKLSRDEIAKIKPFDSDPFDTIYNIVDVWTFCKEKYENVPNDDIKKIAYLEQEKSDRNLIRDDERIIIRVERSLEFIKIVEAKLGKNHNCRKWKLYNDYINDFISKDCMLNNIESEIEIHCRRKNIVDFVKTLSTKNIRHILKNFKRDICVQQDYIEKNRISLDTAKQILVNYDEDLTVAYNLRRPNKN